MSIIIVGGGIGGLTLALSLEAAGIDCEVYESVPELQPVGVGINLLPHAVRELTDLGLGEALLASGVETAELAYYSKFGKLIWSEPRGRGAGYNWPQVSIHRGTLQMLLLDTVRKRLGPERVHTSRHLASFRETATGITAQFARQAGGEIVEEVAGALMIGADGIHSGVRAKFYPDEGPPKWNGNILWRGVSMSPPYLTGRSMIMAGHQSLKFVCYPISRTPDAEGRLLTNWIAERSFPRDAVWRREDWNRLGNIDEFVHWFESWRFDWLDVVGMIRGSTRVYEFPMVDRDPVSRWSYGRITLLGDAAHPMYPIGSNGASQAILDARVLTRELVRNGLVPDALAAYSAERLPATERIVLSNRQNGPEQVMQIVEDRAPNDFQRLEDVVSRAELEGVAAAYKKIAGFDRERLNEAGPTVPVGKANRR